MTAERFRTKPEPPSLTWVKAPRRDYCIVGQTADRPAEEIMSYSTLMVHLELEHPNDARLQIAGDLAEQFDAKLIGVAACKAQPPYYAEGVFAQSLVERERNEIRRRMDEVEARFRAATQKRARDIEWRC